MLIVFKWLFLCWCTSSPFRSIIFCGPWKTKNAPRGWWDLWINTSKYNCGYLQRWNGKNKEIDVICSQPRPHEHHPPPTTTTKKCSADITLHAKLNRRPDWWFFFCHSSSNGKWKMILNMKYSHSCLLCYSLCNVPPSVHPSSIWHIFSPYPCFVCDIIFYNLPRWQRHKKGAEPRRIAWKQCSRDERTELSGKRGEKKSPKKKTRMCEMYFFLQPSTAFNFIWDYWAWWVESCCESHHVGFAKPAPRSDGAPWIPLIAV